jgi:hypothetical protein
MTFSWVWFSVQQAVSAQCSAVELLKGSGSSMTLCTVSHKQSTATRRGLRRASAVSKENALAAVHNEPYPERELTQARELGEELGIQ